MRYPAHPAFRVDWEVFRSQVRFFATKDRYARERFVRREEVLCARVQMMASADSYRPVRENLARHAHLLPSIQRTLAADPSVWVRSALAANPVAHPEVLCALVVEANADPAPDSYGGVFAGLVHNPSLSPADRTLLEYQVSQKAQEHIASSFLSNPEKLTSLAGAHPSKRTLNRIAANPSTPEETLVFLSTKASLVRFLVRNPSLPVEVLVAWAKDPLSPAHVPAQAHPRLPLSLVGAAVSSPDQRVRASAATNLSLPPEFFPALAKDAHVNVRCALLLRPDVPVGLAESLVEDQQPLVRSRLAARFGGLVSLSVWEKLCGDREPAVLAALAHAELPRERHQLLPVRVLPRGMVASWVKGHPLAEEILALAPNWNGTFPELQDAAARL